MVAGGVVAVRLLALGQLDYLAALKVQKHVQSQLVNNPKALNTLITVQHPPVYSLGLREKRDEKEVEQLKVTGAEVIQTDRGGLTTFHGPGQLVAYPIFHLGRFHNMTLRAYVSGLETVALQTCRLFGVPAQLSLDDVSHTGAWANGNKICAIGVHCKRHVTTHGLALNCNVKLSWFDHIVPCGIADKGVTSLSKELGEDVTVDMVSPQLIASFQNIFKCAIQNIDQEEVNDVVRASQQ